MVCITCSANTALTLCERAAYNRYPAVQCLMPTGVEVVEVPDVYMINIVCSASTGSGSKVQGWFFISCIKRKLYSIANAVEHLIRITRFLTYQYKIMHNYDKDQTSGFETYFF